MSTVQAKKSFIFLSRTLALEASKKESKVFFKKHSSKQSQTQLDQTLLFDQKSSIFNSNQFVLLFYQIFNILITFFSSKSRILFFPCSCLILYVAYCKRHLFGTWSKELIYKFLAPVVLRQLTVLVGRAVGDCRSFFWRGVLKCCLLFWYVYRLKIQFANLAW